eukprot:gene9378-10365_t
MLQHNDHSGFKFRPHILYCPPFPTESQHKQSVENDSRKKRDEPGPRVYLEGYDQNMLQGSKWQEFLYRYKTDLIGLIARFLKEDGYQAAQHFKFVTEEYNH